MTYKAFCGPDGTSYCLIVNDLQAVTATRFFIRATVLGVSGFVGLMGLEMPVGPFFESRNDMDTACSPAVKSHFRIYLVYHFTHFKCMVTVEANNSIHDEIVDVGFILQLLPKSNCAVMIQEPQEKMVIVF